MNDVLAFAQEYKDLFWIIFTLVATIVSLLTFFQINKSLHQNLYNIVIEEQIKLYTQILELLKSSFASFLISLDLGTYIKYNLIAHLVYNNFLSDEEEIFMEVYMQFIKQLNDEEPQDEDLWKNLSKLDFLTIKITTEDKINKTVDIYQFHNFAVDKDTDQAIYPGQLVDAPDLQQIILQPQNLREKYNKLDICSCNIYIPQKLKKIFNKFFCDLNNFLFNGVCTILLREESRIKNAELGQTLEIKFQDLYNEIIQNANILEGDYNKTKQRLRKLLKIDR